MLEAMPLILMNFPDAKLYIGGSNVTKSDTFMDRLKLSSYGKYIQDLINKYDLGNNVIFTGVLDEKQMCQQYLRSNVFVCPSSIENSPNSLAEAMILGVPCVASDVGGVSDMMKHNEDGFIYQTDAPYMLAYFVNRIFTDEGMASKFSKNAKEHAMRTHDRFKNNERMIEIYNDMLHLKDK
jgi:glycosyltransferase involved in cell wall biosynthesis